MNHEYCEYCGCDHSEKPVKENRGYLPNTVMTLEDTRRKLAGWHFGQGALTKGEREILYMAEALLRELDRRSEDDEKKKIRD